MYNSITSLESATVSYLHIYYLENRLRDIISQELFRDNEDNTVFIKKQLDGIADGLFEKIQSRYRAHHDRAGYLSLSAEPMIAFLELSEMRELISIHWPNFKKYFRNKQLFESSFDVIRLARNAVAHNRNITGDLYKLLQRECGTILEMIDGTPPENITSKVRLEYGFLENIFRSRFADIVAFFKDRSGFEESVSYSNLIKESSRIEAIGLSLSSISMNLGTGRLGKKLEEDGVDISLYFLDPNGKFVYQRELEEGYHNGELSALTKTSISAVRRAINGTTNAHKCTIRVYDCPLRYNIYIFDDNVAVLQFYGASARGVDSPCFIVKKTAQGGLFDFARNNFDIITSGAYAFDENTGLASRQHPNIKSTSRLWQTIRSTVLK